MAVTARFCNKSFAEFAGIADESIAQAFNIECAEILYEAEINRETARLEALTVGVVSNAFGGGKPQVTVDRSKIVPLNAPIHP